MVEILLQLTRLGLRFSASTTALGGWLLAGGGLQAAGLFVLGHVLTGLPATPLGTGHQQSGRRLRT